MVDKGMPLAPSTISLPHTHAVGHRHPLVLGICPGLAGGTGRRVIRDGCRLSVLSAITSTQQRLKLYNKVPNNGLVLYCGTVLTEDGKERQVGWLSRRVRLLSRRVRLLELSLHKFTPQRRRKSDQRKSDEQRKAHQTDEHSAWAVTRSSLEEGLVRSKA